MTSTTTNASSAVNMNTTTSFMNGTLHLPTSTIILFVISFAICISGFLGNITIAAIILRCKKMQTATNWFVFNLAVCDLAIVIITIPFNNVHQFINWPFGLIGCQYLVMPLMEHLACVCVLTHTAISLVRYTIISRGGIRGIISVRFARIVICLIWLISVLVLSAPLMGFLGRFDLHTSGDSVQCRLTWLSDSKRKVYRVGVFIITYVIPMVITGYSYCKIHFLVRSSLRNVNSLLTETMLQRRRQKARQMDTTLMRMYAMFAIITLPLQLFVFLFDFDMIPTDTKVDLRLVFDLLMNLFYTQILSNPLVLLYMGDEYRKQMRHLQLCCCFFVPRIRKLSKKLEGSFRHFYSSRRTEFSDMSFSERSSRSSRTTKFSFSFSSGRPSLASSRPSFTKNGSPSSLRRQDSCFYDNNNGTNKSAYSCFSFKGNSKNDFDRDDSNRLTNIFYEHTKMLTSPIECDIVRLNQANNRLQSLDEEKNKKVKMLCVIYETSVTENNSDCVDALTPIVSPVDDRETIL